MSPHEGRVGDQLYRHLLITKFNIETSVGYGDGSRRLTTTWLTARLREFEKYCLPSVQAQQEASEFVWVVLCDTASPVWFRKIMASFGPPVTPIFVSGARNATLGTTLVAEGLVDRPWLITTRLDSDDALASTFMRNVQDQFRFQDKTYVEFRQGLRVFRGGLYGAVWRSNPFLSLIEAVDPSRPPAVVYEMNHRHVIANAAQVKVIWTGRHWLRSMHDTNVVQTPFGLPLLRSTAPGFPFLNSVGESPESWPTRVARSLTAYGRVHVNPRARRLLGCAR